MRFEENVYFIIKIENTVGACILRVVGAIDITDDDDDDDDNDLHESSFPKLGLNDKW